MPNGVASTRFARRRAAQVALDGLTDELRARGLCPSRRRAAAIEDELREAWLREDAYTGLRDDLLSAPPRAA